MKRNRAYRIHDYGGPDALRLDEIAIPSPGSGQILVEVKAAGVNPLDWKVREGMLKDMVPLTLPAVLGSELAGVVVSTGTAASRFKVNDRIMGPVGFGAYADYAIVDEATLCLVPDSLMNVQAAAIPVAALTAWQALRAAGELRHGHRVLIHGAAGAVGGFAVQFAKAAGATVLATASATSLDHVLGLGADEVVDYRAKRFEERARGFDLVLDLVGGETLDRSWQVLAPDGAVVSTAAPDIAARSPAGQRGLWFSMQPDAERLSQIARQVAEGRLRSTIAETVDVSGVPAAVERTRTGHAPGKIVADFSR